MIKNKVAVSKFLSFILRHGCEKYGLSLDKYGFADFESVLKILKDRFAEIEKEDLNYIVENDPKMRFQIKDGKVRARYGHSVDVEPLEEFCEVGDVLFHGTSPASLDSILKEGLKPQGRKFVHLSLNVKDALEVGRRKDPQPVILKIDVKKAKDRGLLFWKEGSVVLMKEVPAKYISIY